jgi:predicted amidohydrolase
MYRISAVQFMSAREPEENMDKAERFIKDESKSSDLIIFPEQFIGGLFEEGAAKKTVSRFAALAKRYHTDIVPGSILAKRGARTYNTSYYIDSKGRVLSRYDKSTPWKSEKIAKGRGPRPFDTRFGRAAILICWDMANPSIAATLSRSDLDLIICPSMWWEGTEAKAGTRFAGEFIDSLCLARAYECRAAVAYANAAGTIRTHDLIDLSAGRTQITMPFYGAMAKAETREEQVVSQNIDPKLLKKVKSYLR